MSIPIWHRFNLSEINSYQLLPASLRERVMAQLIDGVILSFFANFVFLVFSDGEVYSVWVSPMIPIYILQTVPGYIINPSDWYWGGYYSTISLPIINPVHISYLSPILWLVYIVYYVFFHSHYGQTPGKMMKGIVVLNHRKKILNESTALFRWFGYIVSIIPLGLGIWSIAKNKRKKGWHDNISNTGVWRFTTYRSN